MSELEIFTKVCGGLDDKSIRLQAGRCLRHRHRGSTCERCIEVCPQEALRFGEEGIEYAADRCSGCGACTVVCPAGAPEAKLPERSVLEQRIRQAVQPGRLLTLACDVYLAKHPEKRERCLHVQCLARCDEALLALAAQQGAAQIVLVTAGCAACPQASLLPQIEAQAARAEQLLAETGKGGRVFALRGFPKAAMPFPGAADGMSRRRFFQSLCQAGRGLVQDSVQASVDAIVMQPKPKENPLEEAKFLPEKWRQLHALLLEGVIGRQAASRFWGRAACTGPCSGCGSCAAVCPTGALQVLQQDDGWRLFFREELCTYCGLCAAICMTGVLALSAALPEELLAPAARLLAEKKNEEVEQLLAPVENRLQAMLGNVPVH